VLVRITQPTGRRLVLCCVLFMGGALREEAHQVQTPEGPVAQQQRDDEQQGQGLVPSRFIGGSGPPCST
jgi:hypothetical protein